MKNKNKIIISSKSKEVANKEKPARAVNTQTINKLYDFEKLEDCRHFLCNLHISGSRVKAISLENGHQCLVEDIPESQIIQRAKELRAAIYGKLEEVKNGNG